MAKPKKPPRAYEVSERVARQALTQVYRGTAGAPGSRPLRIFTLDPSVSRRLGGIATVSVPYEPLQPGPVGSIVEIDPTGAPAPLTAPPLDLDDPAMLLSSGIAPTPANGQFHLQMSYAVTMLTYVAFRRALGREIAWACGSGEQSGGRVRLVVRPFAFEERNAYYDRDSGGLGFGYFRAGSNPAGHTVPKGLVFTALSHDVIVHETTHALLDALRSEFNRPTNPDVLGFHEGFADLVALFLHFTYAEVVEQVIRDCRGTLSRATLLTTLAQEFGFASSAPDRPSALRSAVDVEGILPFDSDALVAGKGLRVYRKGMEAHELGSVLVSAVFEAFVTIFRRRSARLFRIAGLAPDEIGQAALGGELVTALAQEASEVASHFLNISIRAIDYCPPVDLELGEYLRAIITADSDLVQDDKWGYREALMRSFRRRRLFPDHVPFMSEDALRWQAPASDLRVPGLAFHRLRFEGDPGQPAGARELARQADALGAVVTDARHAQKLHLVAPGAPLPKGITYAAPPRIESIRCARRVAPDGRVVFDQIAEVTQSCTAKRGSTLFDFIGGCTIVIDPSGRVRYAIYKRLESANRQERQYRAITGPLKQYWRKDGRSYRVAPGVLRRLHTRRPPR